MNRIFDLIAATPAAILRGLDYVIAHPVAGVTLAVVSVAGGLYVAANLASWRKGN